MVATSLDENQSDESEAGSPENTDESDENESESESQSESDSSEEETGRAGGQKNLFDGIDSDDEDDEDYVPNKKQKQGKKQQPAEKQRIKSPEITQVKGLKGMDMLSRETFLSEIVCQPCEKGLF